MRRLLYVVVDAVDHRTLIDDELVELLEDVREVVDHIYDAINVLVSILVNKYI